SRAHGPPPSTRWLRRPVLRRRGRTALPWSPSPTPWRNGWRKSHHHRRAAQRVHRPRLTGASGAGRAHSTRSAAPPTGPPWGGIADASAMVLDGRASVGVGCRVALLYEGEARVGEAGGALRSERFGVVGRIGPVLAYVGRVDLRFGLGATGGIILGDAVDGVA